jgi:hypothetical protein
VSARASVLLWAQRVIARKGSPAHVLLEVAEHATPDQIQEAFHNIARTSHPDLHRHGLDATELEMVTSAYATVAGAYQELRTKRGRESSPTVPPVAYGSGATPPAGVPAAAATTGSIPLSTGAIPRAPARPSPVTPARSADAPPLAPPTGARAPTSSQPVLSPRSSRTQPANPAQAMAPKALTYYRKAETCLDRGDLRGAVLQLKLACAQDPSSSFLRTALAEVEVEVRKGT